MEVKKDESPEPEDDKGKPKQRHRLLVNPDELGLTGRIRKALLDREMGLTQKIKTAMAKAQDKESPWHVGKYQLVTLLVFFVLSILFGYVAFMSRDLTLTMIYPDNETKVRQNVELPFYQRNRDLRIVDYARKIHIERIDIYGSDLGPEEYDIFDTDGKLVRDGMVMPNKPYTLKVHKGKFKGIEEKFSVDSINVKYHVRLEPETTPTHKLQLEIRDPVGGGFIEPDKIMLLSDDPKDIKNIAVKSGSYAVVIEKAGFFPKETVLKVGADGRVVEQIQLEPKNRNVKLLVKDYLGDIWLREKKKLPEIDRSDMVVKNSKGDVLDFQGQLMPGKYNLEIKRPGYDFRKQELILTPGQEEAVFDVDLVPMLREVGIELHYKFNPESHNPDKAYLQPVAGEAKFLHLFKDLNLTTQKVLPGKYRLIVQKANFLHVNEEFFVEPGNAPLIKHIHLIPKTKILILQILSDYDVLPLVNPDEMEFDMRLAKRGYEAVDWGKLKRYLKPEVEQLEIQADLITLPRDIRAEIKSDMRADESETILPDVLSMTRLKNNEEVGETIHLVSKGKFQGTKVKPAEYRIVIQKTGFEPVRRVILVEPDLDPKIIREELKSLRRPLVLALDSTFQPGNPVTADTATLQRGNEDAKIVQAGYGMKPGKYTLTLEMKGHYPLTEYLDVTPGDHPYEVKKTFKAKPRRLVYNIQGERMQKVEPDRVTFDKKEVRENDNIDPRPGYVVEIQKKGYGVFTANVALIPSEDPFELAAQLIPLERPVRFFVTGTYPIDVNLIPLDECRLGSLVLRGGAELVSVKPDKYECYLAKAGYEPYKNLEDIKPDEAPYIIKVVMKPKLRRVNLDISYQVPSDKKVTPVIKLVSSDGTIVKEVQKSGDEVQPEDYMLTISAPGYQVFSEKLSVAASEAAWDLQRTLVPEKRTLLVPLKADYPPDTEVYADQVLLGGKAIGQASVTARAEIMPGEYTLVIDKSGYRSISNSKFFIPAGVGDFAAPHTLISKERVVTYRIYDAETGKTLIPNAIALDGMAVTHTTAFKPKKYEFKCEIQGYEEISENLEIPPAEGDFKIERAIKASARLILYKLKGDYDNKDLVPSEITLNGKPVDGKSRFKPGDYDLVVYVPGYERLVDQRIHVPPSRDDFLLTKDLVSRNRKVLLNITGTFPPGVPIEAPKVTFGDKAVVSGEEMKPLASGYQAAVEKEGYVRQVKNVVFEPSEKDFTLDLVLEARPRRVELKLDSDFNPNVLISADKVTLATKDGGNSYDASQQVPPNLYQVKIEKAGHLPLEFEETIWPSDLPHILKKTLIAKPRPVNVTVMSQYDQRPMTPKVLQLGDQNLKPGFMQKPGTHVLFVDHPGYQSYKETLRIDPGDSPYEIERTLVPNKRPIKLEITYDVPPGEDFPLPPYQLRLTRGADVLRVHTGDELVPGEYHAEVTKDAYEPIRKTADIPPGEGVYDLKFELQAKTVQLLINITYDIELPPGSSPVVVTLVDNLGQGRTVTHGNWITPGEYHLEISQPGYEFKTPKKPFRVSPRTNPHWITESLYAKRRTLSFGMMYKAPDGPKMVPAKMVLVDHREVTSTELFDVGKKLNVIQKFLEYKTVQQDIVIPPGEGPYVVDAELVKLEKCELSINKKFANPNATKDYDGVLYEVEIYADGQRVEPHQIVFDSESGAVRVFTFYAPKNMQGLQVASAFYNELKYSPPYRFSDFRNINVNQLIAHLESLANSNKKNEVLSRLESMLRDSQDKERLKGMNDTDIEKLANFLRGPSMTLADADHDRKVKITQEILNIKKK